MKGKQLVDCLKGYKETSGIYYKNKQTKTQTKTNHHSSSQQQEVRNVLIEQQEQYL